MLRPDQPLALFMEGFLDDPSGKLGHAVLRYSPNPITCVVDSLHAGKDAQEVTAIPRSAPVVGSIEQACDLGAQVLVLGIAPSGGLLPDAWSLPIEVAIARGLSLVNGLHEPLAPRFPNLRPGQWVWDIRKEPPGLGVGRAAARHLPNRRVLFVGTDMAVGKMTAALEVQAAAQRAGVNVGFVATGQVGIAVSGSGVPLDAIRVDFACSAVEQEVLKHGDRDLVLIEGQGSLIHPGSTSVVPLMRGSCPTHLVLCARGGASTLLRVPEIRIPNLRSLIELYEDVACACGTYERPTTVAVSVNTRGLADRDAAAEIERCSLESGIPATDPVRCGAQPLLEAILAGPTFGPRRES